MPDTVINAVIGFDTSCYTTSAAAVDLSGNIIVSSRKLLSVGNGERGLRQSEAVFEHVKQLPDVVNDLFEKLRVNGKINVAAVCASTAPRDDDSSYMPVFQVGRSYGKAMSAAFGVPFYETSHQRGHIAAAKIGTAVEGDFLAVHLSGGTTEVLSVINDNISIEGGTMDLNAGQLIDRTGVALNTPFPAGAYLEKMAIEGKSSSLLPVSIDKNTFCHMSGAEAQVNRWICAKSMSANDIAAEVFDFVSRSVARIVAASSKKTGITKVLIAGGVSSSTLIRAMIKKRLMKINPEINVYFGKPEYSGDNAVGVAMTGRCKFMEK